MPKTPIDYSKTIIYKVCSKDLTINDCYVGSTNDFDRRGVNAYLDNDKKTERYTNSRAPASYMSLDCFYNELEDIKEQFFYDQKQNGLLDSKLIGLETLIDIYIQLNGENDDDELSALYEQVCNIENEIFDKEYHFTKPSLKNNIISYQFY